MINLFDAGFLHVLFDPKARVPRDKATGQPIVDRAQERIDFLVTTMSQRRDRIILPSPALAEFMLLAADRWNEYLAIIRRKAVFEIAGFDDPEAVELVEHWLAHSSKGSRKKVKAHSPETWAKLKYDRQILAIAATKRVEAIYSTDKDLHKYAKELKLPSYDLKDLPLPPPVQMNLPEGEAEQLPTEQAAKPETDSGNEESTPNAPKGSA